MTHVKRPKVKSMAVICDQGRVLATPGIDEKTGKKFYRLLGGHVELGETTRAALTREIREELGIDVQLASICIWDENIFTYNGEVGHEVIALYRAEIAEQDRRLTYPILDVPGQHAEWVAIDDILSEKTILYPTASLVLLS